MADPIDEAALDTLFRSARSQNGWIDRPLPDGTPQRLWSLISMGPTSANCEPARIVWCVSQTAVLKAWTYSHNIHISYLTGLLVLLWPFLTTFQCCERLYHCLDSSAAILD